MTFKKSLNIGLVTAVALAWLYSISTKNGSSNNNPSNAQSIYELYSTNWRSPLGSEFLEIGRILVKNKIRGCGEYYLKERNSDDTELLVACSSDGKYFKYYLVWLHSERVMATTDDGISPPRTE